jgi:hypothetical protein
MGRHHRTQGSRGDLRRPVIRTRQAGAVVPILLSALGDIWREVKREAERLAHGVRGRSLLETSLRRRGWLRQPEQSQEASHASPACARSSARRGCLAGRWRRICPRRTISWRASGTLAAKLAAELPKIRGRRRSSVDERLVIVLQIGRRSGLFERGDKSLAELLELA